MSTFQCRGHVSAIRSLKGTLSIFIRAKTQFDCKENKIKNNGINKYNVLMEVKETIPPKPFPYEAHGDKSKALSEDMAIVCPKELSHLLQIAYENEATFVIDDDTFELVYIEVGREND